MAATHFTKTEAESLLALPENSLEAVFVRAAADGVSRSRFGEWGFSWARSG